MVDVQGNIIFAICHMIVSTPQIARLIILGSWDNTEFFSETMTRNPQAPHYAILPRSHLGYHKSQRGEPRLD